MKIILKNFIKITSVFLAIVLIITASQLYIYVKLINKTKKTNYYEALNLLLSKLLVYEIKTKENMPIKYYGLDADEIFPVHSVVKNYADVMISYGIGYSCQFEDNFNRFFNKPVYAFDCGNDTNICKNATFEKECIVAEKYPHPFENNNFHYFNEKIQKLNLQDKNLYIKVGIGSAIFYVIEDILKNSDNIVSMSIVFPIENMHSVKKTYESLNKIQKDFILVARTKHWSKIPLAREEIKYVKGDILTHVLLTFINKKYIDKAYLPFNQNNKINIETLIDGSDRYYESTISPIVVLAKKLKLVE